jgi:Fe-S oxidoreductase
VDVAHAALARLGPMQPSEIRLRWHDPCALGRGLGRYEQPRAILTRLLGAPPAEFPRGRSRASCSGGGGLLPLTMPEVSRAIASERIAQHDAEGGGVIVTHCAASLRRFRANGARAIDLATLVRRATD